MQKSQHKNYFFFILGLFLIQCGLATIFINSLSEPVHVLKTVKKEIQNRNMASVPIHNIKILSDQAKPNVVKTENEIQAQAEFEKIKMDCRFKLNTGCTQRIDAMITKFPNSNWTARSLLLLSHYYFAQQRVDEAKSLIHIIKTEFKAYDTFAYDIQQLNSKNL